MIDKELADLLFSREIYYEIVEFASEELNKNFQNQLPEEVIKEYKWLMDGEYDNQLKLIVEAIDDTYNQREKEVLLKFHKENPWFAKKQKLFSQSIIPAQVKIGQEIGAKILKNLAQTGELEKIVSRMENVETKEQKRTREIIEEIDEENNEEDWE
jgi:hypothetical protein